MPSRTNNCSHELILSGNATVSRVSLIWLLNYSRLYEIATILVQTLNIPPLNKLRYYLCDVINHSDCLLFADDVKVCRAINSPSDCLLLQSDIDCLHAWCSANFMKPNFSKIRVISFTRKTNFSNYQYRLGNSFIFAN
jgi:hypothetical protein